MNLAGPVRDVLKTPDEFYPWRAGHQVRLLIDGSQFFPVMLQAIRAAKSHVVVEMYIMESGRITDQFIDAISQIADQGIVVQLLLDGYGSRGLSTNDRKRLIDCGVHLAFYNPLRYGLLAARFKDNFFRTHRKYMIIDGKVAYVGGTGLSDRFVGNTAWHDCMLEVFGPCALDWQNLFDRNMNRWSEHTPDSPTNGTSFEGGTCGRLVATSGGVRLQLKKVLLNRIRHGRRRIWIASAYFIPSAKIRRSLSRAARRCVDVRLLLPGSVTDHPAVRIASHRYYSSLLRNGVRIFEYQERFMHSKVVLIDNWCTIGSSNMDRWNFLWNLEANQEIDDEVLCEDVRRMFLSDFNHCEEIEYWAWRQRSWVKRKKEWLFGKLDRWITGWRPGE